jgi:hypothetical protein
MSDIWNVVDLGRKPEASNSFEIIILNEKEPAVDSSKGVDPFDAREGGPSCEWEYIFDK